MVSMTDVEFERSAQKRIEDLVAISLYQTRVNKVKEYVKELYKDFEPHLKPLEEVRGVLAEEIPEGKMLSQDVVDLRKRETH